MRRLGEFILRGRLPAIVLTSLLAIIGLRLQIFAYLLGGLSPALVTLRKGPVAGLQIIIGSLLLTALLVPLAGLNPLAVIAIAAAIWLPVWFCSTVLRVTEAQGKLLLAAGAWALLYIVMTHLLIGDVSKWWGDWLQLWLEQALQQGEKAQFQEILTRAAPLMNAMTAAGLFISLVTTLLAARWWQALMFNPGGFRREFHALSLPRELIVMVFAGLVLLALDQARPGSPAVDVLFLMIFLYLFQGLSTIHRTVGTRKLAHSMLVVLYVLLLLVPQTILFVACLGMVDSWLVRPGSAKPE